MPDIIVLCPQCKSPYAYPSGLLMICPECNHEWQAGEAVEEDAGLVVKDAHGNILQNGDAVILIKNIPVKGFLHGLKVGTKVKNIKLTDGDHNIDCKIDGFGSMALKSEFVKKV